jgi:hypothetical protein
LTPAQIVMRTACCVTLLCLVWINATGFAQDKSTDGSLDRDVTIVGRDQAALPVPPPEAPREVTLPDPGPEQPSAPIVPPVQPPPDPGTSGTVNQGVRGQSGESSP